jgi:thioredoxin-dependent peroxiredoxin
MEVDMPIQPGVLAPVFNLLDETSASRSLADYLGHTLVLYFYPKDDTPGCTQEACSLRDDYSAYTQADVVILGVSPDSPASHARFKEKYHLPFTLLSDTGHKVCDLYGVWGLKNRMGKAYEGVLRTTFLVGADGKVIKVFENVKPAEHSAEILEALAQLKK